jgi:hypothetical protein
VERCPLGQSVQKLSLLYLREIRNFKKISEHFLLEMRKFLPKMRNLKFSDVYVFSRSKFLILNRHVHAVVTPGGNIALP